ncbi:MAG: EAL domain-containing protein [Lachnospiraceae bacterium]|nr:EAL domain-containing protein [Lachnospiraceae bacterium]
MNIYTQCCGLVILFILLVFDIKHKKVGLFSETVYLNTILINALSVIIGLLSVVALNNQDVFNGSAVLLFSKAHMITIVMVGYTNVSYLASSIYSRRRYLDMLVKFLWIPAVEIIAIIFTPIRYKYAFGGFYVAGAGSVISYVTTMGYVALCIWMVSTWRRRLGKRRRDSVIGWMILMTVAATMEQLVGNFYCVDFACALGMMIIYFTLENPESNMDKNYGCFNSHTLSPYMTQMMHSHENFCMIYLSMADAKNNDADEEYINDKIRQIIDYVNDFSFAKVFKLVEQEFICIVPDEGKLQIVVSCLRNRFYYDQFNMFTDTAMVNSESTTPKSLIVMLTDSTVAEEPDDILRVFQTLRETNRDNITSTRIRLCKAHFDELREKEQIIREIREALDKDRVEVFYQPIYSTKEKKFVSAEALARIRREDNSIVPPGKFIPIAEETGLILKLGERVFEKTCRFIQTGMPKQLGIQYIEVNLSVIQCEQLDLASKYIQIMEENQVNPHFINLEITETATIQAKRKLQQNMKTLMDYGVEFSLDDFGNGHSNLDYVIDMPVDIVKLDMSLIQAYENEKKAKAVVQAAVRMILDMELNALTEGVETKEQLDEMERIGVDYIQGFYFSKPIPENEFLDFLRKHQGEAS